MVFTTIKLQSIMKQLIFFFLISIPVFTSAQIIDIEDPAFLAALIAEGVDDNFDGMIQVSEAEAIRDLEISGQDFRSVGGIEGFTNLKGLAINSNDLIDSIDLLVLPSLELFNSGSNKALGYINISGHPSLKNVDLVGSGTGAASALIEVSITNVPTLTDLRFQFNRSIESVELSGLNNLTNLTFFANNDLNYLDLSDLTSLVNLTLSGTFFDIKFGDHVLLEKYIMGIRNNFPLDLTHFPILKELDVSDPYSEMQDLKVFDHPTLETLSIENYFSLLRVECHNLPALSSLTFSPLINELKKVILDSLTSIEEISIRSLEELSTLEITNAYALKDLSIEGDKLAFITLEYLPALTALDISTNRIETLDISTLTALNSFNLQSLSVESLFIKNKSNENLFCDECEQLQFICADNDDTILFIPPTTIVSSFCPYTSEGKTELSGQVLYDVGGQGCDSTSYPVPYHGMTIFNESETLGFLTANENGEYLLFFEEDTISLVAAENPINTHFFFDPDTISLIPNDTIFNLVQDICMSPKELVHNLEMFLIDPVETRPGEIANYQLKVRNLGTAIPQGKMQLEFEGDFLTYEDVNPNVTMIDSSTLEWLMPSILPFQEAVFDFDFLLNRPTDNLFPLDNGDSLRYVVKAMLDAPPVDTIITNYFFDNVVNSYDPNDKQCLQGQGFEKKDLNDAYLYYMIRFENLGSADARNIVVLDTLEEDSYIIPSFKLVDASHEVYAKVDSNVVSFVFENINLGFDDDENDGYVLFKIKPISTLDVGHKINNSGSIYFDYNFPIHTNTAVTEIISETSSNSNVIPWATLDVFPTVSSQIIYLNGHFENQDVRILNMQGAVISNSIVANDNAIDISKLTAGVYILNIRHADKRYVGKFIKI